MLLGDTTKFLMLVAGLFFATFLMIQPISIFCGLMRWTTSTLKNVPAPIYVVEERVEQINETNPLRDTDLARVRSVSSVAWAMPLFTGIQRARLPDGSYKMIQLNGIDSSTLTGAPLKMLDGNLADLRQPNAIIIDDLAVTRLSFNGKKLKVGDRLEINDIEARVVGICHAIRSFTGAPYVWTTYDRALQYAPPSRKMLSAILAAPVSGVSLDQCSREIAQTTGLRAYQNIGFKNGENDFNYRTMWWYTKNTGIPISIGITVVVGFIVGMAISCQTFYAFILENLKYLGALKAMGVSNFRLSLMLLTQASVVGFIGFGLGSLAISGFGSTAIARQEPPFYLPWQVPVCVFFVIQAICLFSALLGIIRLSLYEPAMVFRST